jgi:hypothetical protein
MSRDVKFKKSGSHYCGTDEPFKDYSKKLSTQFINNGFKHFKIMSMEKLYSIISDKHEDLYKDIKYKP